MNIKGTIEELSFIFQVSKDVNASVINEIARAKARDNFVIIAQNPNKTPEISLSFFLLSYATSDWIEEGKAISTPRHIPIKIQIIIKYKKSF